MVLAIDGRDLSRRSFRSVVGNTSMLFDTAQRFCWIQGTCRRLSSEQGLAVSSILSKVSGKTADRAWENRGEIEATVLCV